MEIGLRFGLVEEIAQHPQGITAQALARQKGLDPLYVRVWCRAAYSYELLELGEDQTYRLAPYMDKLLLDPDFPGYIGAAPVTIVSPEIFDQFAEKLPTGQRSWWNEFSPTFIQRSGLLGRASYIRLIPKGLSQVPGLANLMDKGVKVLEMACGIGEGLMRMAQTYPKCTFVGVDGDDYSIKLAGEKLRQAGLHNRICLRCGILEDLDVKEEYDVALINNSMHECRDLEKVIRKVYQALRSNGHFVISELPFPDSIDEYRTTLGRIMCGNQFFEALIGAELLPIRTYMDLLGRNGFRNVDSFKLAPTQAVIHGQK